MRKSIKMLFLIFAVVLILGGTMFIFSQARVNKKAKDYIVNSIENLPKSDAVLVLGARVYSDGTPSPLLADRLDYGYEVYTNNKAKKIILSGDNSKKEYNEVKAMKKHIMDKGVPEEDIFVDNFGVDTYDSMYRARDIFKDKSMIIATQKYHISRSVYIARELGIDAYGYPCEDKQEYNMFYNNWRESLAKVKAVLNTEVFHSLPKYLGEEIPIWSDGKLRNNDE